MIGLLLVLEQLVQKPAVTIQFPTNGEIQCRGRAWPDTERPALVDCRDRQGRSLLRVRIEGGYIRLKTLQESPLGVPLVVAVGISPGGSDTTFTTALIGEADGHLVDMWPRHWVTNTTETVCLGEYSPSERGVLGLSYIWGTGPGESHYAPHHYRATRYPWDGSVLRAAGATLTKRRVAGWREAAADLGYTCAFPYGGDDSLDAFR
jgi:hypothetical protein